MLGFNSLIALLPRVIFLSHKSLLLIPTVFWGLSATLIMFPIGVVGNRMTLRVSASAQPPVLICQSKRPHCLAHSSVTEATDTNLQPEHDIRREV